MFSFTGGELPRMVYISYLCCMLKWCPKWGNQYHWLSTIELSMCQNELTWNLRLTQGLWPLQHEKTQNQHHLLMKIYVSVNNPQVAKYLIEPRKKQLQAYYLPLYWLFFNVHRDPEKVVYYNQKNNLNNQLFCSFAQLSSTIQSKSFTPSTAPPGRNLQLKGYRRTPTEFGFFFSGKS